VISKTRDVRQSPQWSNFLETLGWKSFRTSKGINIQIRKSVFGALVKIQKPNPFDKDDLNEIENICQKQKATFIKIEPYFGQDIDLLKDAGFEISWFPMTPTATYFINLEKSEEELWNNISHSGKYSIHRAQREGADVKVFRKPDSEITQKFYEILRYTGKMQGIYVPPLKQIMSQTKAFDNNGVLLMVYNKDGQLCGAKWHLMYGDSALYISGGTSELGRKDRSGYELVWRSLLYFKSLGIKSFDFEGKNDDRFPSFTKRWGGFSHFKEKFGGSAVEFPHPHIKYLSPVIKFLHRWTNFNL